MKTVYKINLGSQLAFAYESSPGILKYKTYFNVIGEVLKEEIEQSRMLFGVVPLKTPTW